MYSGYDEEKNLGIVSRRRFLTTTGMAVTGTAVTGSLAMADFGTSSPSAAHLQPLPWPWKQLDPMEAGKRAFNYYHEKGG